MEEGDACVVCEKEIPQNRRHKTAECEMWGCPIRSCCLGPVANEMTGVNRRDMRNRGRALPYQCFGCERSWCKNHHEDDAAWKECDRCEAAVCDMCYYKHYSTCPGCEKTVCTGTDHRCWNTEEGYEVCTDCLEHGRTAKPKKRQRAKKRKKKK